MISYLVLIAKYYMIRMYAVAGNKPLCLGKPLCLLVIKTFMNRGL